VALVVAGLLMLVLGSINSGMGPWARLGTVALGLAFLGYGLYIYFFLPESVWIAFYVFVIPVIALAKGIKSLVARHEAAQDAAQLEAQQRRDAQQPTPDAV
jgi:TRAP-type C4-dicarboxylate transport system permease small subunit